MPNFPDLGRDVLEQARTTCACRSTELVSSLTDWPGSTATLRSRRRCSGSRSGHLQRRGKVTRKRPRGVDDVEGPTVAPRFHAEFGDESERCALFPPRAFQQSAARLLVR